MQDSNFPEGVRWLDPLVLKCSKIKNGVKQEGQLIVVGNKHAHWQLQCVDFDNHVHAQMGKHWSTMGKFLFNVLGVDLSNFTDVSPPVGSQVESECGARAAVFARWFGTERPRASKDKRELDVPVFLAQVAALVLDWRAAR